MTTELDRSAGADLALMALGCVMTLVSLSAVLALAFGIYVMVMDGEGAHPISWAAATMMLVMGVWNFWQSIVLVSHPSGRRATFIFVRSLFAVSPIAIVALLQTWGV